jgi:hypothetical protein
VDSGSLPITHDFLATARSIAQIQTNRQLLLCKIPRLPCLYGANLLHSVSFISCAFERVDNLGAYSIPSETGLLIPSGCDSYRVTSESRTDPHKKPGISAS